MADAKKPSLEFRENVISLVAATLAVVVAVCFVNDFDVLFGFLCFFVGHIWGWIDRGRDDRRHA